MNVFLDAAIIHADDVQTALHLAASATGKVEEICWLLTFALCRFANACGVIDSDTMDGQVAEADGLACCGTIIPRIDSYQQFLTILDGEYRFSLDILRIVGWHLLVFEDSCTCLEVVGRVVDVAAHAIAAAARGKE